MCPNCYNQMFFFICGLFWKHMCSNQLGLTFCSSNRSWSDLSGGWLLLLDVICKCLPLEISLCWRGKNNWETWTMFLLSKSLWYTEFKLVIICDLDSPAPQWLGNLYSNKDAGCNQSATTNDAPCSRQYSKPESLSSSPRVAGSTTTTVSALQLVERRK